jgi:hypothetical protein
MNFTKTARRGTYAVDFTTAKGQTFRVKVAKREVMNPSARGGAYRTEWAAKFGDTIGSGDTRTEAVNALVRKFAAKGITLTAKASEEAAPAASGPSHDPSACAVRGCQVAAR